MVFTDEQKAVIESVNGFNLVIACPGSGKTTTMLERIRYMIDSGIDPEDITMVTFTTRAAAEMQEKFLKSGNKYIGVTFSTIHSMCYKILQEEFGITHKNILTEDAKQTFFYKELREYIEYEYLQSALDNLLNEIGVIKNKLLKIEEYNPVFRTKDEPLLFKKMYYKYEAYKSNKSKLDFDDMMYETLRLFLRDKQCLEKWQDRMPYIIVDEYQDTNVLQANIFYLLSSKYGNFCAVGDDDQSIYAFRCADTSIMLKFPDVFSNTKIFTLSTNYRSGSRIIEKAKNLISYNYDRYDKRFLQGREKVRGIAEIHQTRESADSITDILDKIKSSYENGVPYKDMAILYRINKQSIELTHSLIEADIPINIYNAAPDIHNEFFFKDVVAYWNFTRNFDTTTDDFYRIVNHPPRFISPKCFEGCDNTREGIGKCAKKQAKLKNKANYGYVSMVNEKYKGFLSLCNGLSKITSVSEFVKKLYNHYDYQKWAEEEALNKGAVSNESLATMMNIVINEASNFSTMEEWLQYIEDFQKQTVEGKFKDPEGVVLSTFHSAKGLEWEHVYLYGINKKIVPFGIDKTEAPETRLQEEEERRVFYVAMTRAKEELHIYTDIIGPSPFIEQLNKPGEAPYHIDIKEVMKKPL